MWQFCKKSTTAHLAAEEHSQKRGAEGKTVHIFNICSVALQKPASVLRGRCRTHFLCVFYVHLSVFVDFIGMGSIIIVCNVFFFLFIDTFIDRIEFKGWGKPIGENKISTSMDFKQKLYAYFCKRPSIGCINIKTASGKINFYFRDII